MATNAWWEDDPTEIYWMEITDRSDIGGELWAPQLKADGNHESSYDLVAYVQPGDRVFHWSKAERAIVGWSEAVGPLTSDIRSWHARGVAGRSRAEATTGPTWVVPLREYHRLESPVTRANINGPLFEQITTVMDAVAEAAGRAAYSPFQRYSPTELRAQQGYLSKMPAALVALLLPDSFAADIVSLPQTNGPRQGRGQSFVADAARRAAIERHAVERVIAHYRELGATDILELGKPYDINLMLNGVERHIEVKGSTIDGIETIEVTQGEVEHARSWSATDLVIVDGIEIAQDNDGALRTSGGFLRAWTGWVPADTHLRPTHLRYALQAEERKSHGVRDRDT